MVMRWWFLLDGWSCDGGFYWMDGHAMVVPIGWMVMRWWFLWLSFHSDVLQDIHITRSEKAVLIHVGGF